jgi:hypothetical protein
MKLKRYKSFLEDLKIETTDAPNISASKNSLNNLSKNIKDFKQKKQAIDSVYLKSKDDKELSDKISSITKGFESNPFITEYLNVSSLKRKLETTKKSAVDDKLKLDDFRQEMSNSTDAEQKASIDQKIKEITSRIQASNSEVIKMNKSISDSEKKLNSTLSSQEKDMNSNITNITKTKIS